MSWHKVMLMQCNTQWFDWNDLWYVLPSFPNILIVHTFLHSRCWRLNSKLFDQLSFTGQCFKGNWFSGAFSLCPRQRKQQVAAASVCFCGAIFKFKSLTNLSKVIKHWKVPNNNQESKSNCTGYGNPCVMSEKKLATNNLKALCTDFCD